MSRNFRAVSGRVRYTSGNSATSSGWACSAATSSGGAYHTGYMSCDSTLNGRLSISGTRGRGFCLSSGSYGDNAVSLDPRYAVPWADKALTLTSMKTEVELGFDPATAYAETQRCLNCDVQTVFARDKCIECDACVDICPMDCITFTANGEEADLRARLRAPAPHLAQDLFVSGVLSSKRVLVKDEDVCLHCGLCAERCPTGAWDMKKSFIDMTHAGQQPEMQVVGVAAAATGAATEMVD